MDGEDISILFDYVVVVSVERSVVKRSHDKRSCLFDRKELDQKAEKYRNKYTQLKVELKKYSDLQEVTFFLP